MQNTNRIFWPLVAILSVGALVACSRMIGGDEQKFGKVHSDLGLRLMQVDASVTVELEDDVIQFVDFYLNDALSPFHASRMAPFSATLSTVGLPAGRHEIRVVATVLVLSELSTVTRYVEFEVSGEVATPPSSEPPSAEEFPVETLACDQTGDGNFFGCYYRGINFGELVFTRYDEKINFNYGRGSPDPRLAADQFSIRWRGNFDFSVGRYEFTVTVDDGVRLYVNGQMFINQWKNQVATRYMAEVDLTAGKHLLELEYYEDQWDASVALEWRLVNAVQTIQDPPTAMDPGPDFPTPAEYGARVVPRSKTPDSSDVYVSPNGSGTNCTQVSPCALSTGISRGGFIWLMDGVYHTSSQVSVNDNKTIEALNRHQAIIDFGGSSAGRVTLGHNNVLSNFIIRGSGQTGVMVFGNNNRIEGMISENHYYSGFAVWPSSGYRNLTNPTGGSDNIFRDTIARNNSENCDKFGGVVPCSDSDADGFSISAGRGNQIIHCEADNNADDGIDVWRSYETVVRNSIARGNGKNAAGQRVGNGNGFKMGSTEGPVPNNHRFVNNWSYDNQVGHYSRNGGSGFAEIRGNRCDFDQASCSP